jgi:hypothetical protein
MTQTDARLRAKRDLPALKILFVIRISGLRKVENKSRRPQVASNENYEDQRKPKCSSLCHVAWNDT